MDSPAVRRARVLVRADLDGDGRPDTLSVTGPSGPCPDTLVAAVGGRHASLRLGGRLGGHRLAPGSVTLVQVPGRRGLLVGARETRPHGGFQLHLFAYADGHLGELRDRGGSPLVPAVPTGVVAPDAGPVPVSAGCLRRSIVVVQAVPHRPRGATLAWDVRRTRYTVSGARVTGQHTTGVARDVPPARLRSRYPDLVNHVLFRRCAAATPLSSGTVAS